MLGAQNNSMRRYLILASSLLSVLATPEQIHLALAGKTSNGDHNSMTVSWQTEKATATSVVKYGKKSGVYDQTASGSCSTYYKTFDHHVTLGELAPETEYFYVVGDSTDGYSVEKAFRSAATTQLRGNFSFAVFADLGVVNGESTTAYLKTIKDDIKLVWHGGDISYADDSFSHFGCYVDFCYEDTWNTYMKGIEDVSSKVPYMTAPGNHEADCHDPSCMLSSERKEKLSNFTAYNHRFQMPSTESGGALNMHYSFNYGSVHFISIDTETGYKGAEEETKYVFPCGGFADQISWLENDLIQANKERDARPWILVQGHHPMYWGDEINAEFQAAMEDLFYKYGVDMYFSGHKHSYERDYPVYKSAVTTSYSKPLATTYVMIGGAGNDEMDDATVKNLDRSKDMAPHAARKASSTTGPWTAVTDTNKFGIGKVTIVDDSNLKFEYYRTTTGELYDKFTLTRDHSIYKTVELH